VKKRNYFAKYSEQARKVLDSLLEKYADTGIENIDDIKILTLDPFKNIGTASELVSAFGGKSAYLAALHELEENLYA
jgi:type I restriction enzyme R subunit